MNKKEAALIKVMAQMGQQQELSPEQEELFQKTVNGTEQEKFIDDVHRLLCPTENKPNT